MSQNRVTGASLTEALVADFEQVGIDPCGERGEYHTFVSAGPLFAHSLPIHLGQAMTMPGYQLVDVFV
jgi:diphthamide synthase (EF-2-diphthine--ammonia ligase)